MFENIIDIIWDAIEAAWDFLKKTWVKIVNFAKNIVSWFRDTERLRKLKEDKNKMAIVIKKQLDEHNYQVVNCLFDEKNSEIIEGEVIESEGLDSETREQFTKSNMLVLK